MRVDVIPFENVHQLHFDCIAGTITNCPFRTDRNDEIVVDLRSALLYCTDYILSNVPRKPFVYRRNFDLHSLKLIDSHWSYLQQRTRQKILDTLFGWRKFYAVCFRACRIL